MRFSELATRTALGTTNRPVRIEELPQGVAATLPAAPPSDGTAAAHSADPATVLLDATASYALIRTADAKPGPDAPPLELPASTRLEAPPAFTALLRRIRTGGWAQEPLQREALRLLAERDLTLPPDLLLDLVDDLHKPGFPVHLFGKVLDDRAWALLRLDSAWAGRLARSGAADRRGAPQLWDEGTLAQRTEYLAAVRSSDPAAGLALVEGLVWRKETAEARERLLRTLRTGLSPADEPLLERCLDDRARSVREAAAELLAGLPGTALLARAEALAMAHLGRRKRLLRAPVTVASGIPRTDATTRDGYPADEPDTPAEARRRLGHVISLVPTDRWPALLGASAVDLATAPVECDDRPLELRGAWVAAAVRWGDATLARALVAAGPEHVAALAPLLTDAERAILVERLLPGAPKEYQRLAHLLSERMDPQLTAALADVVEAWVRNPDKARWQLPDLVARLALGGYPAAAPAVASRLQALAERLPADERSLRRVIGEAGAALQLRAALVDSLTWHPALTRVHDEEG